MVTLARRPGRSSPAITLDHYAHFMPEAGDRRRNAVDALFDGWGSGSAEVTATRYVTPLREGGSLPGLVEADDLGTYVMKSSTSPG
ncbi:hypothetical protein [Streptomyces albus]|uniref:hypothetical protein n=1 Tax=Streptomyces sp. NRRL F-5639 TaxID=1463867 RepID=UPI00056230DE|nr:hypothetical protein [Streptomyces sp. NRRL F-5639]